MICKKDVLKYYDFLKKTAQKYEMKNDINKSISYYSAAVEYMYNHNAIYRDDNLENSIKNIFEGFRKINKNNNKNHKILFFEADPKNTRGLTHIYLQALCDLHVDFVWVTFQSYHTEKENQLMELIDNNPSAKLIVVNDTNNNINTVIQLENIIVDENINIALVVPEPWNIDLIGILSVHDEIYKILVNGTDHAFWYGCSVFDKFLEFREFGYNVSLKYRRIPIEKLDYLPFYPVSTQEKFKGFPFSVKKNTSVITSGGSIYKIQGSTVFFDMITNILEKNKEAIFYFMNLGGDDSDLKKLAYEKGISDRFIIGSSRSDFDQCIKNSDLYINTYPLIGGLMTQYAVANNVIPLTLCNIDDYCNDISQLFLNNSIHMIFENKDDLCKEANRILANDEYRSEQVKKLRNMLLDAKSFADNLGHILKKEKTELYLEKKELSLDFFVQQYYERGSKKDSLCFMAKVYVKNNRVLYYIGKIARNYIRTIKKDNNLYRFL